MFAEGDNMFRIGQSIDIHQLVEGRDLYIREGCNNCHSQLVRPFRSEVKRYGEYSKSGELGNPLETTVIGL